MLILNTLAILYVRCHYALRNATYPTWSFPLRPPSQRITTSYYKIDQITNPNAASPTKFTTGFQAPNVGAAATETWSGPLVVADGLSAKVFVFPPAGRVDVLVVTDVATPPPPDTLMLTTGGIE